MMHAAILLWLSASSSLSMAQNAGSNISRACPLDWDRPIASQSKTTRTKNRPPSAEKNASETTGACVELKASALDVQEYLQVYVRDQKWRLTDEHVSESSWTFSRELSPEELSRDTKAPSGTPKIEWEKGTVVVHIDSSPVDDGWSRTTIRASFRGYGQNQDRFATQRQYWELESNNAVESQLVAKLLAHKKG